MLRVNSKTKLQATIFLVIWPTFNFGLTCIGLYSLNAFTIKNVIEPSLKLWLVFSLAYGALKVIERYQTTLLSNDTLIMRLLVHIVIIIGLFALVSPVVDASLYADTPRIIAIPLALLFTQILVYVAVLHIFEQQQKSFETQLVLKESQLNVLRAQTNPHFLFNTMNLITSEIMDNPENAVEIVYDLSDLLRNNIALSNQSFTTVSEEFHMVELFLTLQQKRFKERLDYEMDIGEGTQNLKIPALLLQPAIENAIKHAVAPYPKSAKIQVRSFISDARLVVEITDSGPNFDDQKVIEHDGFRILRKTLALHYPNQNDLSLTSTEHGGLLRLSFPAHAFSLEQKDAK